VASYAYDYLGRRVSRTIYGTPDVTIKYAYDGDRIIAEYDGSGTLLRKFIYGPGIDEPICLVEVAESNAVYYYHFDGLGSVVALSDVNSVLVERYTYDIFGRPAIRDANGTEIAASAFANPYRFTGRAYDAETGLYYYRARYYDYATGRFLQADPTGYTDGLNLYTYVGSNPLTWTDPFGLCKGIPTWKKALAAAVIGITFVTPWPGDEELSTILLGNLVLAGLVYNAVAQPGFTPATTSPAEPVARSETDLPATKGPPNGTLVRDDGKGNAQIRDYGPDGRAKKDFDFGHDHGQGDPHVHDYDWSKYPAEDPRGPGRPLGPGD
jgi:RHS repeat-associated protein